MFSTNLANFALNRTEALGKFRDIWDRSRDGSRREQRSFVRYAIIATVLCLFFLCVKKDSLITWISSGISLHRQNRLIEKYEAQRNNVKNNREYDSLSKEIEFQDLEVQLSEKKINDTLKSIAQKKELLSEVSEELEGRKIDLENKKKELESIVEETRKDEEQLLKESEEIQGKIDPRMLNAYKKVRSNARNKLAVVTVKRDACGGCFNKIPPQKQLDIAASKKIIVCEYCGRILVSPEFDNE